MTFRMQENIAILSYITTFTISFINTMNTRQRAKQTDCSNVFPQLNKISKVRVSLKRADILRALKSLSALPAKTISCHSLALVFSGQSVGGDQQQ